MPRLFCIALMVVVVIATRVHVDPADDAVFAIRDRAFLVQCRRAQHRAGLQYFALNRGQAVAVSVPQNTHAAADHRPEKGRPRLADLLVMGRAQDLHVAFDPVGKAGCV